MLLSSYLHVVLLILTTCAINFTTAFVEAPILTIRRCDQHSCRSTFRHKIPAFMANNNDDENNDPQKNQNDDESIESQKMNTLLDKQFFDPDSDSNQGNWFALLVKNDYEAAEAIYVGIIGIVGVIVSQEMLRYFKYGGEYIPFGHVSSGNLF
mmetsp:Transcript_17121/g.34235  ORF Transcript_17121/g.34235 Transcript_17121/m.34235 type:complete len:153 (-) Transcript_17121:205-663(-)